MIRSRRGFSLIEMIFVIGLGSIVLTVGYRMYATAVRAEQFDSRRQQVLLASQNLLSRIKQDVRSANLTSAFGSSLVLNSTDRRITYRSLPGRVERGTRHGWAKYPGLRAEFRAKQGGVWMRMWSDAKVNGRPVRIDATTFVRPRR